MLECSGVDSSNDLKQVRDVAQLGSALRSGRRGRWFESSHPDFINAGAIASSILRWFSSTIELTADKSVAKPIQ